ncbi:MAG: hypothetical protein P8Y10_11765 [Gemmatimonadales bacterium]
MLLLFSAQSLAQQRPLRVLLDVEWSDTASLGERRIGDRLLSHLGTQFRALGDVEVLAWDEGWGAKRLLANDAGVGVLGFHDRDYGVAVLIEAWTACPGIWPLYYDSPASRELANGGSGEGSGERLRALSTLLHSCRVQNARWLHILPTSNMAEVVRGMVARIDNDVLEPLRQGRRPEKLRVP